MALITPDYIIARAKHSDLISLTESEANPGRVDESLLQTLIADAEGSVYSALCNAYQYPPSGTAEALSYIYRIVYDIAMYYLYARVYDDAAMKDIAIRYNAAMNALKEIKSGQLIIPGLTTLTSQSLAIVTNEPDRYLTQTLIEAY